MAKALLGHVGIGNDPRLLMELRRLHTRVRDLEDEIARVRAANDVLAAAVVVVDSLPAQHDDMGSFDLREPALT